MTKISLLSLLVVALFMIEIYEIINDPANYIAIGVIGAFTLAAVYVESILIKRLSIEKSKEQEDSFQNVYRSEKAAYLLMRKYFDQFNNKMDSISEKAEIPSKELLSAQKALAKVQINRNKENADALLISNDRMLEKISRKLDNSGVADLSERYMSALAESNKDVLEKQQEILDGLKELENSLRNDILESANKLAALKPELHSDGLPGLETPELEPIVSELPKLEEAGQVQKDLPDMKKQGQIIPDLANLEMPEIESIDTGLPGLEMPELEPAVSELPGLEMPEIEPTDAGLPALEMPELGSPVSGMPSLETPELEQSVSEMPELEPAVSELPGLELPELEPEKNEHSSLKPTELGQEMGGLPGLESSELEQPMDGLPGLESSELGQPMDGFPGLELPELGQAMGELSSLEAEEEPMDELPGLKLTDTEPTNSKLPALDDSELAMGELSGSSISELPGLDSPEFNPSVSGFQGFEKTETAMSELQNFEITESGPSVSGFSSLNEPEIEPTLSGLPELDALIPENEEGKAADFALPELETGNSHPKKSNPLESSENSNESKLDQLLMEVNNNSGMQAGKKPVSDKSGKGPDTSSQTFADMELDKDFDGFIPDLDSISMPEMEEDIISDAEEPKAAIKLDEPQINPVKLPDMAGQDVNPEPVVLPKAVTTEAMTLQSDTALNAAVEAASDRNNDTTDQEDLDSLNLSELSTEDGVSKEILQPLEEASILDLSSSHIMTPDEISAMIANTSDNVDAKEDGVSATNRPESVITDISAARPPLEPEPPKTAAVQKITKFKSSVESKSPKIADFKPAIESANAKNITSDQKEQELDQLMKDIDMDGYPDDSLEDLDIDKILNTPSNIPQKTDINTANKNQVMSSEEIEALIAGTDLLSEPEPSSVTPDISNPSHVMNSDEIAALIANM